MRYFPLFFDFKGKTILITGGGHQALTRLRLLAKSEARIRLVASAIAPELAELAAGLDVETIKRAAKPVDLYGVSYVFAATGDIDADRFVAEMARAKGVPVNAMDQPGLCDFLMPAIVDRDPIVVAIGTEGNAPLLARDIRAKIDRLLPARLGALARFAGTWRRAANSALPGHARRSFWQEFLTGLPGQKMLAGAADAAIVAAMTLLANHARKARTPSLAAKGRVSLVGAGPGDPDLLTLKAHRLLQDADIVVHDRLVDKAILDGARRDARFIDVGKPSIFHQEITEILIREARDGKHVVRLVDGDPFTIGHGGEDLAALEQAGIEATLVPGISAAMAYAASDNPPLPERRNHRIAAIDIGDQPPEYFQPHIDSYQTPNAWSSK